LESGFENNLLFLIGVSAINQFQLDDRSCAHGMMVGTINSGRTDMAFRRLFQAVVTIDTSSLPGGRSNFNFALLTTTSE